jgi:hypothetical protein
MSFTDDAPRAAARRRRLTIAAVGAAVLLCIAAGVVLLTTGDAKADRRVELKTTLPDGTTWTGSIYLRSSGRTVCLTSPARDGARWAGPGCLSGAFLTDRFRSTAAVISAVGVVHGANGRRIAVVYGYVDSHSRVSFVKSDGIQADAIHVSSRTLTLSHLKLKPFVAVVPLGSAPGQAFVGVVGPDGQTRMQHIFP